MRHIEGVVLAEWTEADRTGKTYFPQEFAYRILQIDPKDSWSCCVS